jgi:hypothetical protein
MSGLRKGSEYGSASFRFGIFVLLFASGHRDRRFCAGVLCGLQLKITYDLVGFCSGGFGGRFNR